MTPAARAVTQGRASVADQQQLTREGVAAAAGPGPRRPFYGKVSQAMAPLEQPEKVRLAAGGVLDPTKPPAPAAPLWSLDKAEQKRVVDAYPEVGNDSSWANKAFLAGLSRG